MNSSRNFIRPPEANRARKTHLEGIIGFFPWMATVDAFQHWIYTHAGHTRAERKAAYLQLMDRFGGDVDWTGFEEVARAFVAPAAPHFHPSVLLRRIRHRAARRVAGLGKFEGATRRRRWTITKNPSRSAARVRCRNCFSAAGCKFQFDAATIKPLIQLAGTELKKL